MAWMTILNSNISALGMSNRFDIAADSRPGNRVPDLGIDRDMNDRDINMTERLAIES
jgi:hypothetical protein